jgi:Signal transduction histidine kinase, nitrate/nitrite-specific
MRERAARIGAAVEVVAAPGQGTTVTLTLPPHPVASAAAATTAPVAPETLTTASARTALEVGLDENA